jgi:LemA protein
MRAVLIIIGILVVIGLIFGFSLIGTRNELVQQREAIRKQWADVDSALQRRADLIPNLVNTVKGYAKHEEGVFTAIANARAQMAGARTPQERIQANTQLDSALSRLLVVVENYPQLRANEQFNRLMDELAGTENRINVERRKYNEVVQRYNTNIQLFPKNIAASLFGFSREDAYFKADVGARTAPQVQF